MTSTTATDRQQTSRMVYISGRYRHWRQPHSEGNLDADRMLMEARDEARWESLLLGAGYVVIPPIRLSTGMGPLVELSDDTWIAHAVKLLRTLCAGSTCILMRPGFDHLPCRDPDLLVLDGMNGVEPDQRPRWYIQTWEYDPSAGAQLELAAAVERKFPVLYGKHEAAAVLQELERLAGL